MSKIAETATIRAIDRIYSVINTNLAAKFTESTTLTNAASIDDITVAGSTATITIAGGNLLVEGVSANDRAFFTGTVSNDTGDWHQVLSVTDVNTVLVSSTSGTGQGPMVTEGSEQGTVTIDRVPLDDLDMDLVADHLPLPGFYYAHADETPYTVNEDVACFIYHGNDRDTGQRAATSDGLRRRNVGSTVTIGAYVRIMEASAPTASLFPSGKSLTGREMAWLRANTYASTIDFIVQRYAHDGANVLDVETTTIETGSEQLPQPHHYARIEWAITQDFDQPVNVRDG
jgi:hypothetical protein